MATKNQSTYSLREQKFAFLYAQGIQANDSARQAGYSENTCRKKAFLLPRKPKIHALVQQYRRNLGMLDADLLQLCLTTLSSIANDATARPQDRRTALRELQRLIEANRTTQLALSMHFPYPSSDAVTLPEKPTQTSPTRTVRV